jgi:glycerol-1-phosphate dehydrogenase [NAD(P)+]
MSHKCPIDHVIIGENALDSLPDLTEGYASILLVADKNTYRVCGRDVERILESKLADTLIYEREGILVPDELAIDQLTARVTSDTDLIVGVGSGVINDLCKIVSFRNHLPYYIVATAPSMDGYASRGSALILDGMKVTLNADVPKAIIADTAVLASAPTEMIQAGYGDIIGKYSCLNDWRLSALVRDEYLCPFVMNATYETVETTVKLADGVRNRDKKAVGALMEALVAVGILMAYVGNSRPASGSEHHLSHYFEIVGIERHEDYLAHGIDVCFSAIETAKIREKLIALDDISEYEYRFDSADYEQNIRRIYGTIADEVIALQNKMGWYDIDRIKIYKEKWQNIRAILADAPSPAEMLALCEKVGLNYGDFTSLYGEKKIADAILYAKDLKDRYTVLWMNYDLK